MQGSVDHSIHVTLTAKASVGHARQLHVLTYIRAFQLVARRFISPAESLKLHVMQSAMCFACKAIAIYTTN